MKPEFIIFLKKIYDLTGGELRIINQYQVGEALALSSKETDKITDQLIDSGLIKKMARNRIIIRPHTINVMHSTENSEKN